MSRGLDQGPSEQEIFVAALVATVGRPELLNRALPSILSQTRLPNVVIIVLDGEERTAATQQALLALEGTAVPIEILVNDRCRGASGAWNTGLAWLAGHLAVLDSAFVAILDDDDSWTTDHLQQCCNVVRTTPADWVIPGIIRHCDLHPEGRSQSIPTPGIDLTVSSFLTSNPHVQGSNLFVRLVSILHAGTFDEALQSCTDRDLCIRLLELGPTLRATSVPAHTVHHHAETNAEPRLSTPHSRAKVAGLAIFYRKYSPRMSEEQTSAFLTRASQLFGYDPTDFDVPVELMLPQRCLPPTHSLPPTYLDQGAMADSTYWITAGLVSDSSITRSSDLLQDLIELEREGKRLGRLAGLEVIVLENSPQCSASTLTKVVRNARQNGLTVTLVTVEEQRRLARAFPAWVQYGLESEHRRSIACTRSVLQRFLHASATRRAMSSPTSVPLVWVLDDDKRVTWSESVEAALVAHESQGSSVVLAVDKYSAPLPAAFTVRTQLVDILANLHRALRAAPDDYVSDATEMINVSPEQLLGFKYFYHDVAQGGGSQLEFPFWWPASEEMTAELFLTALVHCAERHLLTGGVVTRPLVVEYARTSNEHNGIGSARVSNLRGGSTFIFALDLLSAVPNTAPIFDGGRLQARRSDMVWCVLCRAVSGATIHQCPGAFVIHNRSDIVSPSPDLVSEALSERRGALLSEVIKDILGAAAYRAIVQFPTVDSESFASFVSSRLTNFLMSAFRIHGAAVAMLWACTSALATSQWRKTVLTRYQSLAIGILSLYDLAVIQSWVSHQRELLPQRLSEFQAWASLLFDELSWHRQYGDILSHGLAWKASPALARRRSVSVIGSARLDKTTEHGRRAWAIAMEVGALLMEEGFNLVCGGLGGVMEAACCGARTVSSRKGLTIGVLPGADPRAANAFVDVALPTGLQDQRNQIVALSDAVVVIAGATGTLQELTFAWSAGRLIIAMVASGGVAREYAGRSLDHRREDVVVAAITTADLQRSLRCDLGRYTTQYRASKL